MSEALQKEISAVPGDFNADEKTFVSAMQTVLTFKITLREQDTKTVFEK